MTFDPEKHHRRSIRLKDYDYSQAGGYFVTLCAQNRECLFGEIVAREMVLNNAGRMVTTIWNDLPQRFDTLRLDEFVVMPNHFHGIVVIVGAPSVGAPLVGAPSINDKNLINKDRAGTRPAPPLGDIVGAFKSITTHKYIGGVEQNDWPPFQGRLWQRNYYEHIIRNEDDFTRIRQYISENPLRWTTDQENPETMP